MSAGKRDDQIKMAASGILRPPSGAGAVKRSGNRLLPAGLHYQRVLTDSGLAFSQAFPEVISTVLVDLVVALELDGAVVLTLVITVLDPLPLGHFKALGGLLVDLLTQSLVHIVKFLVGFHN